LADPKKNPAARPATLPKIDKASFENYVAHRRPEVSNSIQTAAANWRKFCESTAAALSQAPVTERSVALPPETRKGTAMAMATVYTNVTRIPENTFSGLSRLSQARLANITLSI
jgi:hypothetical protein